MHDSNFGGVVRVSIYVILTTMVWHLTPAYDMTYIYNIPKYMDKNFYKLLLGSVYVLHFTLQS